jgi:hypothetical protein
MEDTFLVFIGTISRKKEWRVQRKPNFSDFIILSHHSSPISKDSPYQFIPLRDIEKNPIYFSDENIQIIFYHNSVQIELEGQVLQEEVYEVLGHFAILQGRRVLNLAKFPVQIMSHRKGIILRTLSASKRIRESDDRKLYGKIRCRISRC